MTDARPRIRAATAQERLRTESTGHRQIRPDTGVSVAEVERLAGSDAEGPVGSLSPRMRTAAHRDPAVAQGFQALALETEFQHGGVREVVEQAIGPGSGERIHRSARRHAEAPEALPAGVLKAHPETGF